MQSSYQFLLVQNGNAVIGSSGSRFRQEKDGDFVVLGEVDTENFLDVKESSTDPKTAIITKDGADSQKWKYLPPEPPVRNFIIYVYLLFLCLELAFSPPSNITMQ